MPRGHILFYQEKDAKVIQGECPLDIPLMKLAAFPAVWAAIFLPIPGANTTGFPRDGPKNRRLPPKPPTLLRAARRALGFVGDIVRDARNHVAIDT